MSLNIHRLLDPIGLTGGGGSLKNGWDPAGGFTGNAGTPAPTAQSQMDPALEAQLTSYFNSNPSFAQTYGNAAQSGGRTPAEWMYDHIQSSPQDQAKFSGMVNQTGQYAPGASTSGDARYQQLVQAYKAQTGQTVGTGDQNNQFNKWASDLMAKSGASDWNSIPQASINTALGVSGPSSPTTPLEQDLLSRTTNAGYADWAQDANRKADAAKLLANYAPIFDGARNTIGSVYDGSMLQGEYGANATAQKAQQDALNTQMATRTGALDTAVAGLTAAQAPVNQARLDQANTAATAVNLATQGQKDQIMAGFAQDGYVGGNSGTDGQLARASISGLQQSADMLGQAKFANASDTANIGKYGATEGRSLTDYGAGENRSIADSAAQRNLGFFSNDINRRLNNLSAGATLANNQFAINTTADNYGNLGYNRFMANLQNFRTNPTGVPTTNTYQQPVIDSGSGNSNLGAGLLSLAGGVAQNQNYWSTPNSNPGAGAKTSYANFLAANPNSSAATGQNQNDWSTPNSNPGAGAKTSYANFLAANPNSSAATGQM